MDTYIDKTLLLVTGVLVLYKIIRVPYDVVYLLIAIIGYGMTCYLEISENDRLDFIYFLLIIPGFWFHRLIAFIPITAYSVSYRCYKKYVTLTAYGLVITVQIILGIGFLKDPGILLFLVPALIAGVFLGNKARRIHDMSRMIIRMRDDSTEIKISLENKNRELSQDKLNEVRIATLSERNRIAREIHDNVGHILSRTILQLGAVMTVNKNEKVYEQLLPIKDSLDLAMNSVRESVHDLHKESFDMEQAARAVLDTLSGYEVKLSCDFSQNVDKEIKYAFITILKEAVTNITKYCNGDKVTVVITEINEHYQMLIKDNGTVSGDRFGVSAGIGISNMEQRVKSFNGIISVSSTKGFRIFISIPKRGSNENNNS